MLSEDEENYVPVQKYAYKIIQIASLINTANGDCDGKNTRVQLYVDKEQKLHILPTDKDDILTHYIIEFMKTLMYGETGTYLKYHTRIHLECNDCEYNHFEPTTSDDKYEKKYKINPVKTLKFKRRGKEGIVNAIDLVTLPERWETLAGKEHCVHFENFINPSNKWTCTKRGEIDIKISEHTSVFLNLRSMEFTIHTDTCDYVLRKSENGDVVWDMRNVYHEEGLNPIYILERLGFINPYFCVGGVFARKFFKKNPYLKSDINTDVFSIKDTLYNMEYLIRSTTFQAFEELKKLTDKKEERKHKKQKNN